MLWRMTTIAFETRSSILQSAPRFDTAVLRVL